MIDFDQLTKAQKDALALVAVDLNPATSRRTLESLVNRGLLEEFERILPGRFPVRITEYTMPIHVHIAWCEWCSRQDLGEEA